MSFNGATSGDSLLLPVPANVKRKRGLSLRSQLLNKSLWTHTDINDDPKSNNRSLKNSDGLIQNIELDVMEENSGPNTTPHINIIHDDEEPKDYQPYNTLNSNMSRSTTQLTYASSRSDLTSIGSNTYLGPGPRYRRRNRFYKFIKRILGQNDLQPTENGRIIPLSLNKSDANSYFLQEFYDTYNKSYLDERSGEPYCSNLITSSKYNIYTFLPLQLKAQFSKIANCYFMVVAIMQMIPSWSTTGKFTTIVPLLIFMSISIAREGFDDWKRHGHDKEENNKFTTIIEEDKDLSSFDTHSVTTIMTETMQVPPLNSALRSNQITPVNSNEQEEMHYTRRQAMKRYNLKETKTPWKHLKVGDFVKVREDEWFPADVVLLSTSEKTNEAFVETMALDGETNLKPKAPHPELESIYPSVPGLKNNKSIITVEDPNTDLYNFEGRFQKDGTMYALGLDNVAYRGSILRNTKSVIGVVIFTGEETKIRMNNIKRPRTKAPKLQRNINYIVIFMVFVVLMLSCFSMMAQRLMYDWHKVSDWYLFGQDAGVAPTLMGFIIMYNTLIPLSLYVTMEIIKVMQLLFLQFDIDMYHAESNTPADAKTATILEELGQVSFVFTDKTGTLTDNKMEFRKFSVCGESWLHNLDLLANQDAIEPSDHQPSSAERARTSMDVVSLNSHTSYRSTANPNENQEYKTSLQLLKHLQLNPNTIFSKKVKFFLLSIALCNTCLPRSSATESSNSSRNSSMEDISEIPTNNSDGSIEYQAASPDELALVKAARDLGYVVFDKQANTLTIKTYPMGFENDARLETYEVLNIVEFTSSRKRMSAIVRFPDQRICLLCKGADNIIIEKLKNSQMVQQKAKEISQNSADRKIMEADIVLQSRFSNELESRKSLSSLRQRLSFDSLRDGQERARTMNSIDNFLLNKDEGELTEVASQHRKSLHNQQVKKYSLDMLRANNEQTANTDSSTDNQAFSVPNDRLVLHEEYVAERTLQHIEEFSTEGLRTLMYSFKWLDEKEYETWADKYASAKTALTDRAALVEEVGGEIEYDLELLGATAIEDKLQDGVSEAIEKLRRAGIKLWMLTGDKRETAINIGYSCRLIKDYSTVVVLSNDEPRDTIVQRITSATSEIQAGRVAHFVLVIDGATLGELESDSTIMTLFFELCVLADSTICCRASPSQKASMVSSVRDLNKRAVTLAIGDGANDIAMIQSADIGVGITGKEGLQAARSADYAIAQFRFLLKLLLVHGRYNYVRTSKFVLCTFYKELLFYLTQALYQRNTLFSGSSLYESWSLSMFNTLFTSLPILCIGMFDKDLKPATLIAVPELYAKGREYRAFNLRVFVAWMFLAAFQSVGISFISWYIWGFTALHDNSVLPLGTMMFAALTIIINAKITLIEMQNRQWLAFASFIISVGGYGLWNVLIMFLYRSKDSPIFFVAYGLLTFGSDASWWAGLLILFTIPLLFDIFLKVFLFSVRPSDDQIFQVFERNIDLRRLFEQKAIKELAPGWTYPKELSIWRKWCVKGINRVRKVFNMDPLHIKEKEETLISLNESTSQRKRAGTNPNPTELPPGSGGEAIRVADRDLDMSDYDILPSGKMVKIANSNPGMLSKIGRRFGSGENVDEIIAHRLESLRKQEEGDY